MITTNLYLDTRYTKEDSEVPVKIQLNRRSKTALLPTGISVLPDQWDKRTRQIIKHPHKANLNAYLLKLKLKVDDALRDMLLSGKAADMTITEIKNEVQDMILGTSDGTSLDEFVKAYAASKSPSTATIIMNNWKMVCKYDDSADVRLVRSIREAWAAGLSDWLEKSYSPNTRKQVISSMSAVFNRAVERKLVPVNPFRNIRVSYVATRKRNLTQTQFRELWNTAPNSEFEALALDFFKLSFLLIAINPADLVHLTKDNIFNGRVDYQRAKTKKHYSVKIVDEAMPLMEKYAGKSLIFQPVTRYKDYHSMLGYIDHKLNDISERIGLPKVSMYWCRHSWATFATEIDIPVDVVSDALGHSHGSRITATYINKDQKKVDDANRAVINYALYE